MKISIAYRLNSFIVTAKGKLCDKSDKAQEHCFVFGTKAKIQSKAMKYCKKLGGFLADIKSRKENAFIVKNTPKNVDYWLAMIDRPYKDSFVWATTGIGVPPVAYWKDEVLPKSTGTRCMAADKKDWVTLDCKKDKAIVLCARNSIPKKEESICKC